MSSKEIAHSIIDQFDEVELQRFIARYGQAIAHSSPDASDVSRLAPASDDLEERRAAFAELEALCRPLPDLDEKAEIAAYWEEKHGK